MIRSLTAITLALILAAPALAGRTLFRTTGAFTSIEANPISGSLANPYNLTASNLAAASSKLLFGANYSGGPAPSGVINFTVADAQQNDIFLEYTTGFTAQNHGFDATNLDTLGLFLSGSITLDKGKVTDASIRSLDEYTKFLSFVSPYIELNGNQFVLRYDPTFAPNYTGATIRGTVDLANATYRYVPEPATWAMMIVGFSMAGAAARRRSHPARARA